MFRYTPRQLAGFLYFAQVNDRLDDAKALSIGTMAARGDPKHVKKTVKEWTEKP